MKTIEEIFSGERGVQEILSDLKSNYKTCPSWAELNKQFDPKQHEIVTNPTLRPDAKIKNGKQENPAKLTYAAEKIATRRMTQMAFSIPVKRLYQYDKDNELEVKFVTALEAVYQNARINGVNSRRMFAYFGSCEAASFWYVVEGDAVHNLYGFPTKAKIKVRNYSPMPKSHSGITQASIYPLFDDNEDMIALSLEYKLMVGTQEVHHFDCFTANNVYYFRQEGGDWIKDDVDNPIGKIPAVYFNREMPIYEDIPTNRNEIEFTLSRNSDSIRKNSNPILKVSGQLKGDRPAGDTAREVYQMENGGDLQLISPALSTENSKEHINILKQMIEESTQLPNLSMENVKSLGAISGESRKTLLTDAHLKVTEESHDIVWGFDREFNVIKAMLCAIEPKFAKVSDNVTCQHVITPFIQNDEAANIDKYLKACGEPVMSQRTAIEKLGIVEDADAELETIQAEAQAKNAINQIADAFAGAI